MSIGENVKTARKLADLTQDELAKRANLSRSYIGDIENDRYNPSLSTLEIIAKVLGQTVHTLLGQSAEYDNPTSYYHDPEVAELANEMKENPDLRVLFDATRDLDKESIAEVMKFVKYQRSKERGDFDD